MGGISPPNHKHPGVSIVYIILTLVVSTTGSGHAGSGQLGCGQYCQLCNSTGCIACDEGQWGPGCLKDCPENCRPECGGEPIICRQCDQKNGVCTEDGCYPGYWGTRCENPCSFHCDGYCKVDTGKCLGCRDGYWGATCTNDCINCLTCQQYDGTCGTCSPGYFGGAGTSCVKCPANCGNGCDPTHGWCNECKEGWSGQYCSINTELTHMCKDVVNKVVNHYTLGSECEEVCVDVTGEECAGALLIGAELPLVGWVADIGVAAFCGVEMLGCTKACGYATEKLTESIVGQIEDDGCESMSKLTSWVYKKKGTQQGNNKKEEEPIIPDFPSEFSVELTTHLPNHTISNTIRYSHSQGQYYSKETVRNRHGQERTTYVHRNCTGAGLTNISNATWSEQIVQECIPPANFLYEHMIRGQYQGKFTSSGDDSSGGTIYRGYSEISEYESVIEYRTARYQVPLWLAVYGYDNHTIAYNTSFGPLRPYS